MLNLHWALYIVIANIAIAFVEYTYRAGQYQTFAAALPYIVVPILVGQWLCSTASAKLIVFC